jgi:hypothetical protein
VTLTVALTAEEEAKLLAEARVRGVSPDALVRDALKHLLDKAEPPEAAATAAMTPEERARAFVEWAGSFPPTPPLSDDAVSWEGFYRDDAK